MLEKVDNVFFRLFPGDPELPGEGRRVPAAGGQALRLKQGAGGVAQEDHAGNIQKKEKQMSRFPSKKQKIREFNSVSC